MRYKKRCFINQKVWVVSWKHQVLWADFSIQLLRATASLMQSDVCMSCICLDSLIRLRIIQARLIKTVMLNSKPPKVLISIIAALSMLKPPPSLLTSPLMTTTRTTTDCLISICFNLLPQTKSEESSKWLMKSPLPPQERLPAIAKSLSVWSSIATVLLWA